MNIYSSDNILINAILDNNDNSHKEIYRILYCNFSADIDVNVIRFKSATPLMLCAENGELDIVNLLIEYGAKINLYNNFGLNALMYATIKNHINIVALLLEHGSYINEYNWYGKTALIMASHYGYVHIVSLLLDKKANVNLYDNIHGNTALMYAVQTKRINIVRLLLDAGADINIPDKLGKTVSMYASENDNKELIALLK